MEGLSIEQQASLLRHSNVVVAAHGGALTNMVFAEPGTTIIELFGKHVYPYYYGLSNLCNHSYHALLQHPDDYASLVQVNTALQLGTSENQRVSQSLDFSVDIDALKKCLESLIAN